MNDDIQEHPNLLFRYDDLYNQYGNPVIVLTAYRIVKRTSKGVWVFRYPYCPKAHPAPDEPWYKKSSINNNNYRFVLNKARKRWAYPTRKRALQSFIQRRKRQIDIISSQLDRAERSLAIGKTMMEKFNEQESS